MHGYLSRISHLSETGTSCTSKPHGRNMQYRSLGEKTAEMNQTYFFQYKLSAKQESKTQKSRSKTTSFESPLQVCTEEVFSYDEKGFLLPNTSSRRIKLGRGADLIPVVRRSCKSCLSWSPQCRGSCLPCQLASGCPVPLPLFPASCSLDLCALGLQRCSNVLQAFCLRAGLADE